MIQFKILIISKQIQEKMYYRIVKNKITKKIYQDLSKSEKKIIILHLI